MKPTIAEKNETNLPRVLFHFKDSVHHFGSCLVPKEYSTKLASTAGGAAAHHHYHPHDHRLILIIRLLCCCTIESSPKKP